MSGEGYHMHFPSAFYSALALVSQATQVRLARETTLVVAIASYPGHTGNEAMIATATKSNTTNAWYTGVAT